MRTRRSRALTRIICRSKPRPHESAPHPLLPQEALGHTVVYQPLDITSQASIDALARWVEAQGGCVCVAVGEWRVCMRGLKLKASVCVWCVCVVCLCVCLWCVCVCGDGGGGGGGVCAHSCVWCVCARCRCDILINNAGIAFKLTATESFAEQVVNSTPLDNLHI